MSLAGLRIGLVTARASRAGGGVFEAVVRQAALIREAGGNAHVFALADRDAPADRARFGETPVTLVRQCGPAAIGWAPGLARALDRAALDLVHLHGIWTAAAVATAAWARSGRPYLISPHGMLDPWITARGQWKKALARVGWERRSWARATTFHALTADEAADILRATGRRDALVISNAGPPLESAGTHRTPNFLYLGRLHPKKNLDGLLAAWGLAVPRRREATLTIAGWGEPAHVAALERAVAGAGPSVRFVGPAHGSAKAALLATARWLVLPSWSEGLPMVALEAWAAGTPTILTEACHLPDGFASGAALQCTPAPASIAATLTQALAMDDPAWRARQAAALALAAGPFAPATVATRWAAAYRSLTGLAA